MMTTTAMFSIHASFLFPPCPLFCSRPSQHPSPVSEVTHHGRLCVSQAGLSSAGFYYVETPHRLQAWVLRGTSLAVPIRRASGTKC